MNGRLLHSEASEHIEPFADLQLVRVDCPKESSLGFRMVRHALDRTLDLLHGRRPCGSYAGCRTGVLSAARDEAVPDRVWAIKCVITACATAFASSGGTAFPIWRATLESA